MLRSVLNYFKDRTVTPGKPEGSATRVVLERLWWLADAPMFIDEALVSSFYDAIVRPEFELQGKRIGEINESTKSLLLGGSGEGTLGLPSFLSLLGADAKMKGSAKLEHARARMQTSSEESEWKAIRTGGRMLEELVAVYVGNSRFHDRLVFVNCPMSSIRTLSGEEMEFETFEEGNNSFPRSLVFLDVQPGAIIIPTMCEFTGGGFAKLHEDLIEKIWKPGDPKPVYPSEASKRASDERRRYWLDISERYNSRAAMEVLEAAATKDCKLEWVDFRLQMSLEGRTLHLHVCPRGLYAAGTFGYNFIRRGNRKGVRIVGSLKRGPDVNVLAIFEC